MPTTLNLRKLLHRKAWEMCTSSIAATVTGSFITGDKSALMPQNDCVFFVNGASAIYNYNADNDAWMQLPNSGIVGSFAAGSCGEFRAMGMLGGSIDQPATGGTTTTLNTNRTLASNLAGIRLRVVAGSGAGYDGIIASNTVGANAVITLATPSGIAFDATTVFRVWSGSLWFFNAGTTAVGFSVYDRATNAWTAKSVAGLPTAWATFGQLNSTGSIEGVFETGTSTGGNTPTTLNKTGATWPVNAYANAQVRIVSGTGAGQVRTIASNTVTALTVSAAWTTTPDATSAFSIEGNDDYLYLSGNNAVTLYRYSISGNAWSTLTPGAARAGAAGAGGSCDWITNVPDADWQGAQGLTLTGTVQKQNGRYFYAFRGAASNALDLYDIAANTWISNVAYGGQMETFTTGSSAAYLDGAIFIKKEATGRIYSFDVARNCIEPFAANVYPQNTTVEGDKLIAITYRDGGTTIPFLYLQQHSRPELLRMMII